MKSSELGMPVPAEYAGNLIYIHISVGIGTIKEQDFGINARFNTSTGNHWVITQSYAMLRQLDSVLSKSSKKLGYIPFPVLDKSTLRDLYKVSIDTESNRATSNFIFIECYRLAFERWLQAVFQRQHLLPFLQREVIREIFHLPNGLAYSSEYFESVEAITSSSPDKATENDDAQSVRSKKSSATSASKSPRGDQNNKAQGGKKRRASILDILKVTFTSSAKNIDTIQASKLNRSTSSLSSTSASSSASSSASQRKAEDKFISMIEHESRYEDELMCQQPLVKVSIHRRLEGKMDKIEYEIILSSEPLPHMGMSLALSLREPYVLYRRYNDFKMLYKVLQENHVISADMYARDYQHHNMMLSDDNINSNSSYSHDDEDDHMSIRQVNMRERNVILLSRFPLPPSKCSLGIALSESDLSYRARRLDQWFREVLVAYTDMNNSAREVVRRFLGFDMSREVDISIQDRLALGMIEASRADIATSSLMLLQPSSSSSSDGSAMMNQPSSPSSNAGYNTDLETMSQYSKNSHHSMTSNVTLTFKLKDEDILSMQNKLIFNTASTSSSSTSSDMMNSSTNSIIDDTSSLASSPTIWMYIIINPHHSARSPYLEPIKNKSSSLISSPSYDDMNNINIIDDGTGSLWKSLSLRTMIPSYNITYDDMIFLDLSSTSYSGVTPIKKPALMKRISMQMNGLILGNKSSSSSSSSSSSAMISSSSSSAPDMNKIETGTIRSISPSSSPHHPKHHQHHSASSSSGSLGKTSDDDGTATVTGSVMTSTAMGKKGSAKSMMRIGMKDDNDDVMEIGASSSRMKKGTAKRRSIFG